MTDDNERAELLAALLAAGAASEEDARELERLADADPRVESIVTDFRDSIVALASSVEPIETSPETLASIERRIAADRGSWWARFRGWLRRR